MKLCTMNKGRIISIILILLFNSTILDLQSSEVDSWTGRQNLINQNNNSSLEILNQFTNKKMLETLATLSVKSRGETCDINSLYDLVYEKLGGFMFGQVEDYIIKDPSFEQLRSCPVFKDSIYKDFTVAEAPPLNLSPDALGCTINIGGKVVGSDKFGHFFGQGYTYFKMVALEGQSVQRALDYGDFTEKHYFGLQANGVYSYADASANYEGMNFWKRLTDEHNDTGKPSYFSCSNGQWKMKNFFDWSEYITPAWDEAVNCNYYRGADLTQKVLKNTEVLNPNSCPVNSNQCEEIYNHYQSQPEVMMSLLSPTCAKGLKDKLSAKHRQFIDEKEIDLNNSSTVVREAWGLCHSIYDLSEMLGGSVINKLNFFPPL